MTLIVSLITLLISFSVYSDSRLKAVVTVLEAPIQYKPRLSAKTIQLARKGQKVYLHPRHLHQGQLSKLVVDPKKNFESEDSDESFLSYYETMDKNGNPGYILKSHVKVIFQDERESHQHVRSYHNDPTDYRLEEPLPDDYPFTLDESYRSGLVYTVGPNLENNYLYNTGIDTVEAANRQGFQFYYGKKANWDKQSRFFFGGLFHFWSSQAFYNLSDLSVTEEQQVGFGLGPYLSYDLWRTKNYCLTTSLSLAVNMTRHQVSQSVTNLNNPSERIFSGLGFMPRLSNAFAIRDIVRNLDITVGLDVQAFLPHELTAQALESQSTAWSEDTINIPFNAHWNLFVGIQGRY